MVGGLLVTFGLCVATARQFLGGAIPAAFGDALRVDGLSALVLVLCGFVGLVSGTYGVGYLRRNDARNLGDPRMRRSLRPDPAYVFAMLLVSMSNNLGIMWIAVELTTLASVFSSLSLTTRTRRSKRVGSSWCWESRPWLRLVGNRAAARRWPGTSRRGHGCAELDALHRGRPRCILSRLRLGVVFALIGYGTKAGLAPMHTWKPDAYGEAPSPAGVLMAVGMLNAALYCVLRIHLISKAALGPAFSGDLLLKLGLLSVLIATPFILVQWNLKRLLAYSSIEHVGIMAVGIGLGGEAGAFGALLHMTYHLFAEAWSPLSGRDTCAAS